MAGWLREGARRGRGAGSTRSREFAGPGRQDGSSDGFELLEDSHVFLLAVSRILDAWRYGAGTQPVLTGRGGPGGYSGIGGRRRTKRVTRYIRGEFGFLLHFVARCNILLQWRRGHFFFWDSVEAGTHVIVVFNQGGIDQGVAR